MKFCTGCERERTLTSFYLNKNGKYSTYCRQCSNEKSREYHARNREKRVEQIRQYQEANREDLLEKERLRRFDPTHREKHADKLKRWRTENEDHVKKYNRSLPVKARGAVNELVVKGELPHPSTMVCSGCDEAQAAHWHHFNGYDKQYWFYIEPLCTTCHGKEHRVR